MIEEAALHSINNKAEVMNNASACCYFCLNQFPTTEITEFTDQGKTVICPKCHTDTVLPIGYATQLKEIHDYWL